MAAAKKPAGGKFAQYRERATGKAVDPIVYGEDEGFDPPITISAPTADQVDLINRCVLDKDKLQILVAGNLKDDAPKRADFERLWAEVGTWEQPEFGELVKDVFGHFFGRGAVDVPGGSSRS